MTHSHVSRRSFLSAVASTTGAVLLTGLGCSRRRSAFTKAATDLELLELTDAARAIKERSASPLELTRACLTRIERLDKRLNSFITVTPERALEDARRAEIEISRGTWRGPLHGIPIALKDNIDTAGIRTTAASGLFADRVPGEDAEVVRRLKAAGAVVLGKLNMHEFSCGTTSVISHFGPVHNPWDVDRVAGGSSGGNAAAVAARFCYGAVGTDTGGSVRIPASCCGIVGLKPTYGLISTRGVIPVSASYDHVGPMCRTVKGVALMLRAMIAPAEAKGFESVIEPDVSHLRVGICRAPCSLCDEPTEPEVQRCVDAAVEVIRGLVAEIHDAELATPDLSVVLDAEAYVFHAPYLAKTPELYDPRTRREILAGKRISPEEYERKHRDLERHRAVIDQEFSDMDLILSATQPRLPLAIRESNEPFALKACTFAFSTGGLPSISVPCGFSSSGLPIGLLISGPPWSEARVIALAQAYESATEWHRRQVTIS